METRPLEGLDRLEEDYAPEVPEDVAILYSWANLEGGRYQDFSANRREHRAQMRLRAAQRMRLIELQAQAEAEAVAKQADMDAAAADATARQAAERASGQANVTPNPGRPAWADSQEVRGDQDDAVKHSYRTASQEARRAAVDPETVGARTEIITRLAPAEDATLSLRGEMSPRLPLEPDPLFEVEPHAMSELFEAEPVSQGDKVWKQRSSDETAPQGPAWLYPVRHAAATHRPLGTSAHSADVPESLKHSKERIAARWFALRGVFERHDATWTGRQPIAEDEKNQTPLVAVFSLAGGTGKTSLVATLGRALSFLGERVLLSDTTPNGLLPFYFGSGHRASGVLRVFLPPPGSTDAPVRLVGYDVPLDSERAGELTSIVEDLMENSQRVNRVLIDLSMIGSKLAGRLGQFKPMVLVPLMPDMNSVISIDAVERLFGSMLDADGCPLRPVYLLNQFDSALPLHLDIREVLTQQLGERLLPFVIRRSQSVGEALAEGMTVLDYDPDCAAAADYVRVANWLRSDSAPTGAGFRNQRWSEQ